MRMPRTTLDKKWDEMGRRTTARLREHCRVQQDRDSGPTTAADAQQRLYRLLAHTTAVEEIGMSLPEARARIAAMRARAWLRNVALPVRIR